MLHSDNSITEEYGKIKTELELVGERIPHNDIWIAAFARRHSYTLYARDRHFERVKDINLLLLK